MAYGRTTRRPYRKWRTLYGSGLALVPDGSLLDALGNPQLKLAVVWTHAPGDIVTSGNGKRYMVRHDRSLRAI